LATLGGAARAPIRAAVFLTEEFRRKEFIARPEAGIPIGRRADALLREMLPLFFDGVQFIHEANSAPPYTVLLIPHWQETKASIVGSNLPDVKAFVSIQIEVLEGQKGLGTFYGEAWSALLPYTRGWETRDYGRVFDDAIAEAFGDALGRLANDGNVIAQARRVSGAGEDPDRFSQDMDELVDKLSWSVKPGVLYVESAVGEPGETGKTHRVIREISSRLSARSGFSVIEPHLASRILSTLRATPSDLFDSEIAGEFQRLSDCDYLVLVRVEETAEGLRVYAGFVELPSGHTTRATNVLLGSDL
jgi:hypothetical protein